MLIILKQIYFKNRAHSQITYLSEPSFRVQIREPLGSQRISRLRIVVCYFYAESIQTAKRARPTLLGLCGTKPEGGEEEEEKGSLIVTCQRTT